MKKKMLLALSLVAGVTLLSLAADSAGGKKSDDSDALRELRAQITQLRAEVDTLRHRTQSLEATVDGLKRPQMPTPLNLQPSQGVPVPSTWIPAPSPSRPPTIWGQGEVNGWTYYVVPCEERSR
jgi:outer membrane murein-binding lipoprotein Lpp